MYHELVPYSSRMPDEVVRGLLENAVSQMPHLASVKDLCKTLKTTTGQYLLEIDVQRFSRSAI